MVEAVFGGFAGVVAEFYDCVAPGAGAECVSYVGEGAAEEVFLVGGGDGVAEGAAGPDWPVGEELVEEFDGVFHCFVGSGEWGAVFAGFGGDDGDVVGD